MKKTYYAVLRSYDITADITKVKDLPFLGYEIIEHREDYLPTYLDTLLFHEEEGLFCNYDTACKYLEMLKTSGIERRIREENILRSNESV